MLWIWPPGLVSPGAAEHVLSAGARGGQLVGRLLDPDQPLATYLPCPAKKAQEGIYYFPNSEKCVSPGHSGFLKKTK